MAFGRAAIIGDLLILWSKSVAQRAAQKHVICRSKGAQIYTNSFSGSWRPPQGKKQAVQVKVQSQSNSSYTEDPVYAHPHLELIVQSPLGLSIKDAAQRAAQNQTLAAQRAF